jgi:hypothetical protein
MPYCFRCLVLNEADVSAPRWKREWLDPTAEFCSVHHRPLETVPASVFRLSNHFDAALRTISRYREKCLFSGHRPPALAELVDSISDQVHTASKINDLQHVLLIAGHNVPKESPHILDIRKRPLYFIDYR